MSRVETLKGKKVQTEGPPVIEQSSEGQTMAESEAEVTTGGQVSSPVVSEAVVDQAEAQAKAKAQAKAQAQAKAKAQAKPRRRGSKA